MLIQEAEPIASETLTANGFPHGVHFLSWLVYLHSNSAWLPERLADLVSRRSYPTTKTTPLKNTEAHLESASGRLADYLESHKDEITDDWIARVRKDAVVPTYSMPNPELIDHIPKIFGAITQALRQPRSDAAMERVHETAAQHSIVRWQQHYDLQAILREIVILRTELIYHVSLFEEQHPDFGPGTRLFAATTIHHILDEIVTDATDKFLKLAKGETGTNA